MCYFLTFVAVFIVVIADESISALNPILVVAVAVHVVPELAVGTDAGVGDVISLAVVILSAVLGVWSPTAASTIYGTLQTRLRFGAAVLSEGTAKS